MSTGVKSLLAPFRVALGIDEQAARLGSHQAGGVIDRVLIRATGDPFIEGRLELTGRVVAAMANHASAIEHRLDVAPEVYGRIANGHAIVTCRIRRAVTLIELKATIHGAAGN
ncbi:MAG: hypothetical protein ACREYC_20405 [Gammaproteobacteria bacterium]